MENKQNIKDLVQKFYPYAKETLGFEHPVRVIMRQDAENAQNSLGKTAYYDPEEKLIVLYITDRHPKDVLRSFSHELVHHAQNCRGELDDLITGGHYAEGGKGREIESEAYLQGNLNVRDWEDNIKFKGVNEMKLTKSQLKGIVEAAIKQMSEGFPDLTGDGKVTKADILKGRGVKLKEEDLDEAQDFSALSSVVQELRMLADGQLDDFNNMAPTEYFKVLADKLENAMRDLSGASDMASSPMEEQEVVTPRSEKEKGEEEKKKEGFKKRNPEISKALEDAKRQLVDKEKEPSLDEEEIKGRRIFKVAPEGPDSKQQADMDAKTASSDDEDTEEFLDKMVSKGLGKDNRAYVKKPQDPKLEENNDTWYQGTLYERLVTKWTK